ncbi:MAG: cob(I)yrinic acid a,c-diamide adenosyltransferase [Bacteroidales bacterium]|nr:cob(I)yrinic acid a,c-diamide adenosyltransferase [Bacteroidales bacterium]
MKIYTRSGDNGTTSLIGGKRTSKSNIRIEAYGTVDELICQIGLLRDQVSSSEYQALLIGIQDRLMICAAILASDCDDCGEKIPELKQSYIQELENAIDNMQKGLPGLSSFVLPGGHVISSYAQVARAVCRRAERRIVEVSSKHFVPDTVLQYINRLSDFLFVFSRRLLIDNQGIELKWNSGL